ncbi:TPA: flagellar biosynthesis protein FlgJ [Legionella pneumophila]|uniref:hypothetical protein n=1 Tax=Legionella longbeachae TaxID=450 RepID=UPI0001BEBCB1|nr:hypothetical protein [Legionella longbeachae]EEZ95979.1 conserved hypothetical protein [Legionella longbeachae D-4968]HEO1516594.1 flagellar biosynthesis protein FlgJ [Legionella pneumophila]
MDVTAVTLRLHPKANEFLFEHYATVRKVFSDVLGQLETDYISIALINTSQQVFFLSSKPSIEQNLIENRLWRFDGCNQPEFFNQNQPKLWSELPHKDFEEVIERHKQVEPGLVSGIAIPDEFQSYKVVFSFGLKRINPEIQSKNAIHCKKLLAMGKFSLQRISEYLTFPDKLPVRQTKPKLTLIINNKVSHEYTPG